MILSPGSDNEGGGRGQSSVRSMEKEKSGLQSLECKAGQLEAAVVSRVRQRSVECEVDGEGEVRAAVTRVQGRTT